MLVQMTALTCYQRQSEEEVVSRCISLRKFESRPWRMWGVVFECWRRVRREWSETHVPPSPYAENALRRLSESQENVKKKVDSLKTTFSLYRHSIVVKRTRSVANPKTSVMASLIARVTESARERESMQQRTKEGSFGASEHTVASLSIGSPHTRHYWLFGVSVRIVGFEDL